jgi:uncharacterized protein (TIGR02444 family)
VTIAQADFWNFSLAVYSEASVQRECLDLQDQYGIDVNLVLFCAFAGAEHGVVLSDQALKEAMDVVSTWQQQVVTGLRTIRRALKPLLGASPPLDTPIAAMRTQVKASELEAERIEQQILERWVANRLDSWPRSQPAKAVVDNIQLLLAMSAKGQKRPALPEQLIARALAVADEGDQVNKMLARGASTAKD